MKQFSLMLTMVLLTVSTVFAQRTVTGTVMLEGEGEAIGANVFVKGNESNGTTTEFDGSFSLDVPDDASALTISYTGFQTQVVTLNGNSIGTITLAPDAEVFDEVVVIGYGGVQSKEQLTGAVAQVDGATINELPVSSIDQALQGQATGLLSTSGSGQPGEVAQVRIRGIGSINAGSSPLYIVDGVPIIVGSASSIDSDRQLNALASISPSDIESVSILKDAAATAIYGARGSNGVILITTKSGKKGEKTQFNFSSQFGVSQKTNDQFRMLNSQEYLTLRREALVNSGVTEEDAIQQLPDSLANVDTDWREEAFQTGITQNYEISARGGSEKTGFFFSGSYFDQEGILINTGLKRYSGRLSIDHDVSERFRFGVRVSASVSDQRGRAGEGAFMDPVTGAYLLLPFDSVRDEDGEYNYNFIYNTLQGANFVGISENVTQLNSALRVSNSNYGEFDITDDLTFKTVFGIDWSSGRENETYLPFLPAIGRYDGGYVIRASAREYNLSNTNTLNYSKVFNEKHNVNVLGGLELLRNNYDVFNATGVGLPPLLSVLNVTATPQGAGGSTSEWAFFSLLSRANYGYDGKYNVSASFRRDASSRFGKNYRWANFWSVGAGWNISEEAFLKDVSFIDLLKLRGSIGTSGNAEISNYIHFTTYSFTGSYNNQNAAFPSALGSDDLRWESNLNWNIGLDFAFWKRFTGSVEYYNRRTFDLLYDQQISRASSGQTTIQGNIAEMVNRGVEAELSVDVINKKDFTLTLGGSVSANQNEITSLVDNDGDGEDDQIDGRTFTTRTGESIGTFYLIEYAGVHPADGTPLYYDEDGNVTSDRNAAGQKIVGTANPIAFGNFKLNANYKGLGLDVLFFYNYGNKIYDNTRRYIESDGQFLVYNQTENALDRWQNPGDITSVPQVIFNNSTGGNDWGTTRYLYDGSYLRLRNVRLYYSIPSDKLGKVLRNVQVYVQGQNLLTFSKYKGFDPEFAAGGTAFFRYPVGKTFTAGLNIGF